MLAYVSGDRCCVTVNANFSLFLPARAKILNVSSNSYSCKLYFYPNNYIFTKMGEKFYKGKSSFKIEKKKKEINSFQICKILLKDIEKFWYRYFVKKKKNYSRLDSPQIRRIYRKIFTSFKES